MFNWLKNLFKSKAQKQTDDAINNLYTTDSGKNRMPLDPDKNPWQT